MLNQNYLKIPKSFAEYCLHNKITSQAKTYVYLKMSCSGKIRLNNKAVNTACQKLNISRGTFYRHLKYLKTLNWIGYSKKSRIYFIRSFNYVCKKESLEGRTCAVFSSDWFSRFKAFLSGAVIGYLVKHQRKSERKKRRSKQTYYDVATKAISKIMNIPESTAYKLKQLAHKNSFIDKKKNLKSTGIHIKYLNLYRESNPDIAHKTIGYNNEIYICMPDKVKGLLRYKTNRSLNM